MRFSASALDNSVQTIETMKEYPLISVVTINFNQAKVTNQLLSSLQYVTYPNVEIIVVDNDSKQSDKEKIDTIYSNVRIIFSDKNLGFAGGNNIGIYNSKGKYLLFLNNDTEVEPNFLEPMLELFTSDSKIGCVSPKIKYFDNPTVIQYAGFSEINPFTVRMHAKGYMCDDNGEYDNIEQTNFAHGCAMMVPRAVVHKIGVMPEEYFLYYEEQDWSNSIKKAGYKIYYQPNAVVYHKESMTVEKNSILKTYYINRNRILFMKRNFNAYQRVLATAYMIFISIPKNTFSFLIKGGGHFEAYWNALLWNTNLSKKNDYERI